MPESGRFYPGATRAVVPKPTDAANGCKLRHGAPKRLQKAQYVGFSESAQPLQVVYFGWPDFQSQEARLARALSQSKV